MGPCPAGAAGGGAGGGSWVRSQQIAGRNDVRAGREGCACEVGREWEQPCEHLKGGCGRQEYG